MKDRVWMSHGFFLLAGFSIGFLMLLWFLKLEKPPYQPSFGVVDAQALVQFEAQKLAKGASQKGIASEKLQEIAERLKQKVALFAYQHQVVVLAKGAVWGGDLPDYTEMILEDLNPVEAEDAKPSH